MQAVGGDWVGGMLRALVQIISPLLHDWPALLQEVVAGIRLHGLGTLDMREAELGDLVLHAVVARPVLEAGPEAVRRGVDVRTAQRLVDRGSAQFAAVAAVEQVVAAVALERRPHHHQRLAGQRHTVLAGHLHAGGRDRPDGVLEVELVRGGAADLGLPDADLLDELERRHGVPGTLIRKLLDLEVSMDGLAKRRGMTDRIHSILTEDWESLETVLQSGERIRDGGYQEEIDHLQSELETLTRPEGS